MFLGSKYLGPIAMLYVAYGCSSHGLPAGVSSSPTAGSVATTTSAELARVMAMPEAQAWSRNAWAQSERLSPAEFGAHLVAIATAQAYQIDGVNLSGMQAQIVASRPAFERLSGRFATMGDLVAATGIHISFSADATEIAREVAFLRNSTSLGLDDTTTTEPISTDPAQHKALCTHYASEIVAHINHLAVGGYQPGIANQNLKPQPSWADAETQHIHAVNTTNAAAVIAELGKKIDSCADYNLAAMANFHPLGI